MKVRFNRNRTGFEYIYFLGFCPFPPTHFSCVQLFVEVEHSPFISLFIVSSVHNRPSKFPSVVRRSSFIRASARRRLHFEFFYCDLISQPKKKTPISVQRLPLQPPPAIVLPLCFVIPFSRYLFIPTFEHTRNFPSNLFWNWISFLILLTCLNQSTNC